MAELADALDLGSNEATRAGSIPVRPTKINSLWPLRRGLTLILVTFKVT